MRRLMHQESTKSSDFDIFPTAPVAARHIFGREGVTKVITAHDLPAPMGLERRHDILRE
jgi:hypothetical protein